MTPAKLRARTAKDLAAMAKKKKVAGWHSMRKEELIRALVRRARAQAAKTAKRAKTNGKVNGKINGKVNGKINGEVNGKANGKVETRIDSGSKKTPAKLGKTNNSTKKKPRTAYAERKLRLAKAKLAALKNLTFRAVDGESGCQEDRLVVLVRDPYWLHAYWELSRASVERAQAALGQHWHAARPVLRLYEVPRDGTTSSTRRLLRDIEIHGGVSNWYIDVQDPPSHFQLDIGYLAPGDRFFSLARSNVASTPTASSGEAFDQNWAEVAKDSERVFAMSGGYTDQPSNGELKEVFEQQLHRSMGDPLAKRFGLGAATLDQEDQDFNFQVETELIVHGTTEPDAHVTLRGEPVRLRDDGSFAVRFNLPNRRHVLPVVASRGNGAEQRTIILAVDRNMKVMETVLRDPTA